MEKDIAMMRLALDQAKYAAAALEVPVGAVAVWDGEVIATAHNRREEDKSALAHAEILAIEQACRLLGGWRLHRLTLYITLEPCPMCAGAIINARIPRVVFGARDPKAGCFGSICDFRKLSFNHKPTVVAGVLEDECAKLLANFFQALRKEK